MRKHGVEVKEMGIGIPLWKLKITLHPRWLPFPLVLSPILLGAYVKPTDKGEEKLKELDFDGQAAVYGAGVFMNIVLAFASIAVLCLIRIVDPANSQRGLMTLLLILISVTALLAVFRKWFFRLMPFIGLLAATFIVYALASAPEETGGPVEVVRLAAESSDLFEAVLFGANISLSLALFNMIPIMPLDGGRTFKIMLERTRLAKYSEAYSIWGTLVVVCFIGYLLFSDLF